MILQVLRKQNQTKPMGFIQRIQNQNGITFLIVNSGKPEHKRTRSQNSGEGTSLVVQWLRLYAPNAGASQVVLVVKNPPASAGDIRDSGSVLELGRSSGGGHGNPLGYSCLENPIDRGVWQASVHGITKSRTRLKPLSMCTEMLWYSHALNQSRKKFLRKQFHVLDSALSHTEGVNGMKSRFKQKQVGELACIMEW